MGQKTKDDGFVSIATKVPVWIANLMTILAKQRDMELYELLQLLVNGFISAAKFDGPLSQDMRQLIDALKLDVAFNKAFNFASPTARMEIAQMVLILQQRDRHGFGMKMIDKPFFDQATETCCVDDILERVIRVAMPGLYKTLDRVGQRLCCASMRETLILLSEYMGDSLDKEDDMRELPGYGTFNDAGRAVEYGRRTKRIHHKSPDSVAQQQTIQFDNYDKHMADCEVKDWEGEHRQHDESPLGDIMPFDVEP